MKRDFMFKNKSSNKWMKEGKEGKKSNAPKMKSLIKRKKSHEDDYDSEFA